jgi:hypothetical protein
VFDTLAQVIVHHRPIAHAAEDLVQHYVAQYAGPLAHLAVPHAVEQAVSHATALGHRLSDQVSHIASAVPHYAAAVPHLAAAIPRPTVHVQTPWGHP